MQFLYNHYANDYIKIGKFLYNHYANNTIALSKHYIL